MLIEILSYQKTLEFLVSEQFSLKVKPNTKILAFKIFMSLLSINLIKKNSSLNTNLDIYEDNHILLNFTSNHDENTWVGTVFDRMGESYLTMSVLTYVMPGIPLLYNGQEYSLNKRLEFFEKDFISKENKELVEFYTSLGQIKRNNKAKIKRSTILIKKFYPAQLYCMLDMLALSYRARK